MFSMKKQFYLLLIISFVFAIQTVSADVFYVSTEGNDNWSGTLDSPNKTKQDGPFATLTRARDAIQAAKEKNVSKNGYTVFIRAGIYELDKTFELTEKDKGTKDSPIVYQAYVNKSDPDKPEIEKVFIIGGKKVTDFHLIEDKNILNRIDKKYHDKIFQANLKQQNIVDYGQLTPRGMGRKMQPAHLELFFNSKPMQISRWPNKGFETIVNTPAGKDGGKFTYSKDRPKLWAKSDDIWLHGYWTWDWADSYVKIKSIDLQKKEILTEAPHGVYGYTKGKRYYYLNILEEIDSPGEWYLDRKEGILYFWPNNDIKNNNVYVSILNSIVNMNSTSFVSFKNITFEYCRGTAINIIGGNNNLINKCLIRNTGNRAVAIAGGTDNGVRGCEIYETGDGGIVLSGGNRNTLTAARNFADNNHIYNYSRWCRTYRPAIMIVGVGNILSHNKLHDGPHNAIQLTGNDHIVEYNEIYNVCYETGDVGAFYTGRDWTGRGTIIRHNYFHDISGPYTHGAMGVYLDDASCGFTIYGNIFYKVTRAAFVGGGRDNTIENNIFVDCKPAVHVDSRLLGWGKKFDGTLKQRLAAMPYKDDPWKTKYPKLVNILEDQPSCPKGNVIIRNICVGGKWDEIDHKARPHVTIKDNLINQNPKFIDKEKLNFKLSEDSPAFKLGFKQVPVDKIGIYDDNK